MAKPPTGKRLTEGEPAMMVTRRLRMEQEASGWGSHTAQRECQLESFTLKGVKRVESS